MAHDNCPMCRQELKPLVPPNQMDVPGTTAGGDERAVMTAALVADLEVLEAEYRKLQTRLREIEASVERYHVGSEGHEISENQVTAGMEDPGAMDQ